MIGINLMVVDVEGLNGDTSKEAFKNPVAVSVKYWDDAGAYECWFHKEKEKIIIGELITGPNIPLKIFTLMESEARRALLNGVCSPYDSDFPRYKN